MEIIQRVNATNPDAVSWSLDLSGGIQRVAIEHGCSPYGNAKARMIAWNLPDPIPVHREVIFTSRPDLVSKYPTRPDARQFRVPNIGFTVQKSAVDRGVVKQFPLILSSGRLVEYEGGGEETRSNKWLAELKQYMYVEINPADASERGIKDGGWVAAGIPPCKPATARKISKSAVLVSAIGQLNDPSPAHFRGEEDFAGRMFHSALWSSDIKLDGKHVAVIGTGATAMQLVPSIADRVASVTVYQRSAQWARPVAGYSDPIADGSRDGCSPICRFTCNGIVSTCSGGTATDCCLSCARTRTGRIPIVPSIKAMTGTARS